MTKKQLRQVTITAQEMSEADITHVSLVKRGANMAPIKIIKEDEREVDMPAISKVSIRKGNLVEPYKVVLNDLGFDTNIAVITKTDEEEWLNFSQEEQESGSSDVVSVEVADGVVIEYVGKAADLSSMSSSFGEALKKRSFFPGIGIAFDALYDVIVSKVTSLEEGVDLPGIEKALNEFNGFVTNLVKSLPSDVAKAEVALKGIAGSFPQGLHADEGESGSEEVEEPTEETNTEENVEETTETNVTDDPTPQTENEATAENAQAESTDDSAESGAEESASTDNQEQPSEADMNVEEIVKQLNVGFSELKESLTEKITKSVDDAVGKLKKDNEEATKTKIDEAVANIKKTVIGDQSVPDLVSTKKEDADSPKSMFGDVIKFN